MDTPRRAGPSVADPGEHGVAARRQLLDEPLTNLDIKFQIAFLRLLRELQRKKGIAIVMALHDINLAMQFEKVMLIKEGSIIGMGSPETVLTGSMLKMSFDVNVEVKRSDTGNTYVSFENNY